MTAPRSVLIVEDNADFMPNLRIGCSLAYGMLDKQLRELQADLPPDGLYAALPERAKDIRLAASEAEALAALEAHPEFDLISMDMALKEGEYGLDASGRNLAQGVGGMRLLDTLRARGSRALTLVVSGEEQPLYAEKAIMRYRTICYFQKARFDLNDYARVVAAALLYQEGQRIADRAEHALVDADNLELARRCLERAQQLADEGSERTPQPPLVNFPDALRSRIELLEARLDRTTRRPTGEWLHEALRRRVIGRESWTVIRVRLRGFEAFRAAYPAEVDALRVITAQALKHAALHDPAADPFVGVLSAEYLPDPAFVLIRHTADETGLRVFADALAAHYHEQSPGLLPYRERLANPERAQQILPQPAIAVWHSYNEADCDAFADLHEAIRTLSSPAPPFARNH
jgi:CheY-like chemotaxis protein